MAFELSKDLETGNSLIDSQHKQLIQAINNLLTACSAGQGRAEVEKTIQFLYDYTSKHFSDEEKLQAKYNYPDQVNHKRYHETFKATVSELKNKLQAESSSIGLVGQVNTQVGGWFVNHIKREDTKVAAHIRANS